MGKQRTQQVDLVTHPSSTRHVGQLIVGFKLRKEPFLTAPAIVESHHLVRRQSLIGDDELELMAVLIEHKQIKLKRLFALFLRLGADEKSRATFPLLRFPVQLKIATSLTELIPHMVSF